ncbi:hypothetical protein BKA93DRAFT_821348 [Sparassis latifolia]|uniref:C2H2-type domain-containing protein n=1 Tax=Sparassis crispa TaxID=139825 RepID=A0A401GBW6_9APHY|nr:predicted protein [Sparassis crispa]GBE79645.1 predicted protein [Sparassis crispa]
MKRSYDYSFVTDTNDITTNAHSFTEQTATPATQPSIGDNIALKYEPYSSPGAGTPSPAFRLPLLGETVGFDFDFQPNVAQSSFPTFNSWIQRDDSGRSKSRLTGLGIRYEGPLYATPIGAVFSPVIPAVNFTPLPGSLSDYISDGSNYLSLRDICHIGSSPILEPPESVEKDDRSSNANRKDPAYPLADSYEGAAYSDCPTFEFRAHSPFASSSLPSLSFCSSEGNLSDNSHTSSIKNQMTDILDSLSSPPLYGDARCSEEPIVGLFADVNMLELAARDQGPVLGVNPADIMGPSAYIKAEDVNSPQLSDMADLCYPPSPSPELPTNRSGEVVAKAEFPDELISAIVSVLSATKQEDRRGSAVGQSLSPGNLMATNMTANVFTPHAAGLEVAAPPICFVPPNPPTLCQPHHVPLADIYIPQAQAPRPKPQLQSPVLNAHQGIELEDLRRRADEYRRENPGFELDKTWLQVYAGRLSQRGEFIEDYRCYVIGCAQRNKRRDHILVHVGSHVEHRPFHCGICGMRFLRKNECKRHEGSHAGNKPFSCPICAPVQEKSFVRQDLLKRHMRITHGVQPAQKRARIAVDEDYWP